MQRLILAALVAAAVLAVPATASANVPSYTDRADAKHFARAYWEDDRGEYIPCARVSLKFDYFPSSERNVFAYTSLYGSAGCVIHYNRRMQWGWWKLCAITIHEYGHIVGKRHSNALGGIMNTYPYPNPVWGTHFPACGYSY